MDDEQSSGEVLALIQEIIRDEQRLERHNVEKISRYNVNDARAFAFKRIANLVLPHSDRIT